MITSPIKYEDVVVVMNFDLIFLSGESPSSSASDVDNANNSTAVDKTALSKVISPPQVVGTHVIAAQNRPNLMRLLNFVSEPFF